MGALLAATKFWPARVSVATLSFGYRSMIHRHSCLPI
jgi:hypothetical protein